MGKIYTSGSPISKVYEVGVNAPFDTRLTVQNIADLTDGENGGIAAQVYRGMVVYVHQDKSLYIYTGASNSTWKNKSNGKLINGGDINNWKKIYGDEINPADYLSYYQQKLGARVVDSFDELLSPSLESPFAGMFGVVKVSAESDSDSEDESGLYVLTREPNTTASNWYRILGGSGSGNADSGLDVTEVITSDGSAPASGTGFSINSNDPDAIVEEVYVDDYLHAGVYYTSKGINSSKDNGGNELDGVDYITLSNGDSWIRFDNRSTITLYIRDDSLGFNMENIVGIINSNGTETINPYTGYPYTESPISLSLNGNTYIKFNKDIYFTGLTEVRGEDSTEYIFGQTGSNYEDLDIYSVNVLPTVYAYADGTPVRVLTEGDKDELVDMISEATDFTPITDTQIRNLF